MIFNFSISQIMKLNYELGKKTWFGTGGNCSLFFEPKSINQLILILKFSRKFFKILIIGSGSNLIIRDGGYDGVVIKLKGEFSKIKFCENNLILSVGAGVKDSEISKFCLDKGISGLEFLSGIPGTIGGNLKMNAGCYGEQISDRLIDCTIIDKNLKIKVLKKDKINFEYRKSSFPNDHIIILARFKMNKLNKEKIKQKVLRISNYRRKSQPVANRTGGSTFTNPNTIPAWKLIDKINFRGKRQGGAKVSNLHSNFIINDNDASSLDIEILGEEIKRTVWEKQRIKLVWELQRIGKFKKV